MQSGMWGANKDYMIAYNQLSASHLTNQIISSALGGNIKPLEPIDKIFPEFFNYATLGQGNNIKEPTIADKEAKLAKQAAQAMLMMGGAPRNIQTLAENKKND